MGKLKILEKMQNMLRADLVEIALQLHPDSTVVMNMPKLQPPLFWHNI